MGAAVAITVKIFARVITTTITMVAARATTIIVADRGEIKASFRGIRNVDHDGRAMRAELLRIGPNHYPEMIDLRVSCSHQPSQESTSIDTRTFLLKLQVLLRQAVSNLLMKQIWVKLYHLTFS